MTGYYDLIPGEDNDYKVKISEIEALADDLREVLKDGTEEEVITARDELSDVEAFLAFLEREDVTTDELIHEDGFEDYIKKQVRDDLGVTDDEHNIWDYVEWDDYADDQAQHMGRVEVIPGKGYGMLNSGFIGVWHYEL